MKNYRNLSWSFFRKLPFLMRHSFSVFLLSLSLFLLPHSQLSLSLCLFTILSLQGQGPFLIIFETSDWEYPYIDLFHSYQKKSIHFIKIISEFINLFIFPIWSLLCCYQNTVWLFSFSLHKNINSHHIYFIVMVIAIVIKTKECKKTCVYRT